MSIPKYAWLALDGNENALRIIFEDEDEKECLDSGNFVVFDYNDNKDGKLKHIMFPTFSSCIRHIKYED